MSERLIDAVQVNMPYRMLGEGLLGRFLEAGLNPEIGLDGKTLDETPPSEFRKTAELFRERGRRITCHAPFLDLSAGSLDPAVRRVTRERLEQTLRAVAAIRPVTVVCHTGWDHRRYLEIREVWLEASLEVWTWFADALRNEGARMMLENVYERGPEELLDCLLPLEEHGAKACLDTGHLTAFGEVSLASWIDGLLEHIGQLHLHDNAGHRDEHRAPGGGAVDFPYLFERLARREPPPLVTLEPHEEQALWDGLAYLEKVWPWDANEDSH